MQLLKKYKAIKTNLGFSLIELLIIIALIALASGLSVNLLYYTDKLLVKSELEKLYALCISLQYKAQLQGKTLSLEINQVNNSYSFENKVYYLSKFVKFGLLNNIKGPPSLPSKTISNPITFKKEQNKHVINFYPDGTITSGAIYFIDSQKNYQFALSVSVAQVSFIRKYIHEQSSHNKWQLI